ncbi:MAG TPA: DNA cytosine methyltransferase [Allosphingosinicella sp.]|nr:DNA cytosine methyltransferase [Allosphingosinicella sp.]
MAVVDFFSGCGGFSLGAHQAGFDVAAAFDIDPILTSSYAKNFPQTKLHRIDLSLASGQQIRALAGVEIDGIVGGPPCQGFSSIGRRNPEDVRRQLLYRYFLLVAEVRPSFFVMENVLGLLELGNRPLVDACLELVRPLYHLTDLMPLNAADFGAATTRRRAFLAGIRKGDAKALDEDALTASSARPANVRAAIGDLQLLRELRSSDCFDRWKIASRGRPSRYASGLRSADGTFTGNLRTQHTYEVLKRFSKLQPGEIDRIGRFPRLSWGGLCPTLRAGTGNDRGSYQSVRPVHPEADRVITVREAARLQGFPDYHLFHPTIWHSFRMIGNSVSPFVASQVLGRVAAHMPWLLSTAEAAE